jgi:hypothetical protein
LAAALALVTASPASATSTPGNIKVMTNKKCLDADLNTINPLGVETLLSAPQLGRLVDVSLQLQQVRSGLQAALSVQQLYPDRRQATLLGAYLQ